MVKVLAILDKIPTAEHDKFAFLKQCGFDGCDFNLYNYFKKDGMFGDIKNVTDDDIKTHFTALKQSADKAGIEIVQTYAEFRGKISCYLQDGQTEADFDLDDAVLRQIACIKATHYLGAKYIVILPIVHAQRRYDRYANEGYQATKAFYQMLLPALEQYGITCLLQNAYNNDFYYVYPCATIFSNANEMVKMCDELGQQFKICLDLGHCALTQDFAHDSIRAAKDMLVSVHINDNPGWCDLHALPFVKFGKPIGLYPTSVDWQKAIEALKEINYNGILSFNIQVPGPDALIKDGYIYLNEVANYFCNKITNKG